MGYIRHHAIIVTSWNAAAVLAAHAQAVTTHNICTEIVDSATNAYKTFVIIPDGSKEGWDESDAGDKSRAAFIGWLHSQGYDDGSSPYSWAEIAYGDDNGELSIRGSR